MNKSKWFTAFIGFIFLILLGYFCFRIIQVGVSNLDKFNPNIIAALIAATITVSGYFITRYLEKQKVIEQQIREKKIPIYESFLGFLARMLITVKNKEKMSDEEIVAFFGAFTEKSLLWMSDETLLAYTKWRNSASGKLLITYLQWKSYY